MSELSQGAYLAWRLAAGETARIMHPCIEKEFVLVGLCGLGKWLRSKAQGENAPLRGQALQAVSTEAQTVETTLKAPPKATGEQVPLVPMLWSGEVYFNTAAGKYHAARLKVKTDGHRSLESRTRQASRKVSSELASPVQAPPK